jgi:hypothetical protein
MLSQTESLDMAAYYVNHPDDEFFCSDIEVPVIDSGQQPSEPDNPKPPRFYRVNLASITERPEPPEFLIDGLLYRGDVALVNATAKAGKTFLNIQLALAVASGKDWLGRSCKQGRVLFINFEVQDQHMKGRLYDVAKAMGISLVECDPYLDLLDLRGALDEGNSSDLVNEIIDYALCRSSEAGKPYSLVIIDPIYKLNRGDENSAEHVNRLFNQFDRIVQETGASLVVTHHHSKGSQAGKNSIDRSSGSGVFGRSPDLILDLIELDAGEDAQPGNVYRVSCTARNTATPKPFEIVWSYPLHAVDSDGSYASCDPLTPGIGRDGSKKRRETQERLEKAHSALVNLGGNNPKVDEFASWLCSPRTTVINWLNQSSILERYKPEGEKAFRVRRIIGG